MKITSKQGKRARSLLKWNINDIVGRSNLKANRIERFERATLQLTRPENDELYRLYTDHGVVFTSDFEVYLDEDAGEKMKKSDMNEQEAVQAELQRTQQQGERIDGDDDGTYSDQEQSQPDKKHYQNEPRQHTSAEKSTSRKNLVADALKANRDKFLNN